MINPPGQQKCHAVAAALGSPSCTRPLAIPTTWDWPEFWDYTHTWMKQQGYAHSTARFYRLPSKLGVKRPIGGPGPPQLRPLRRHRTRLRHVPSKLGVQRPFGGSISPPSAPSSTNSLDSIFLPESPAPVVHPNCPIPLTPILIALSVLAHRTGGGSAGIGDGESAIRIGDRTSRVLHL